MQAATDEWQRALYEAPLTVALGPQWSAIAAGFAVMWMGEVYITPAGQRYLEAQANEPHGSMGDAQDERLSDDPLLPTQ